MSALFAILGCLLAVSIMFSLAWVARDARLRRRSALWVTVLCAFTWPLGFLIWREVRPPSLPGPG